LRQAEIGPPVVLEYRRHLARFSPAARLFLVAQFLYGIGQSAMWVLRNLYLKEAGFEESVIGQTLSASALGMALVVLSCPPLMDRRTLRSFQVLGAIFLAGGLAGVAFTGRLRGVFGFWFLSGVGSSLRRVGSA